MSILKRLTIVGAVAVGLSALFNDLTQQEPGGMPAPPWPPSVEPEEPREPPVLPLYPPQAEGAPPGDEILSAPHRDMMDRCLWTLRSLTSPRVPQNIYREAVYGVNRILVAEGADLIPYHVNVICENMVAGLTNQSSFLQPGQCKVTMFNFAAVDQRKKFAVELCRDENPLPQETRVRLGQKGVQLVP